MADLEDLLAHRPPTADRPLLGLTVLVVEDSRYACEAMRLMCLKSGARLRRAGSLTHARRHLATYRPGAVIIDLGLPDGDGCTLIRELRIARPRVGAILATSGDPDGEDRAARAGADGFLSKPLASLASFQCAILAHLPDDRLPPGPRALTEDEIAPDPIALHDDLAHVAGLMEPSSSDRELDYATQFLLGVARCAGDAPLQRAAEQLARRRAEGEAALSDIAHIGGILHDRLRIIPVDHPMHA